MIICPLETGEEVIEINDGISPEFIENNTRAGECNNCGDCCFVIDRVVIQFSIERLIVIKFLSKFIHINVT